MDSSTRREKSKNKEVEESLPLHLRRSWSGLISGNTDYQPNENELGKSEIV